MDTISACRTFLATIKWQIWLVHNCLLLNKTKLKTYNKWSNKNILELNWFLGVIYLTSY